eukprot:5905450-Prymnesium_polylepis.1
MPPLSPGTLLVSSSNDLREQLSRSTPIETTVLFLLPGMDYALDGGTLTIPTGANVSLYSIGEIGARSASISGGGQSRLFDVRGRLEIRSVKLESGLTSASSGAASGGGLIVRAGGTLFLGNVHVSDCCAIATNVADAKGGAIFLDSHSVVILSQVSFTKCNAHAQWRFSNGGAIFLGSHAFAVLTAVSFVGCGLITEGGGAQGGSLWVGGNSETRLMDCAFVNSTCAGVEGCLLYTSDAADDM